MLLWSGNEKNKTDEIERFGDDNGPHAWVLIFSRRFLLFARVEAGYIYRQFLSVERSGKILPFSQGRLTTSLSVTQECSFPCIVLVELYHHNWVQPDVISEQKSSF